MGARFEVHLDGKLSLLFASLLLNLSRLLVVVQYHKPLLSGEVLEDICGYISGHFECPHVIASRPFVNKYLPPFRLKSTACRALGAAVAWLKPGTSDFSFSASCAAVCGRISFFGPLHHI